VQLDARCPTYAQALMLSEGDMTDKGEDVRSLLNLL